MLGLLKRIVGPAPPEPEPAPAREPAPAHLDGPPGRLEVDALVCDRDDFPDLDWRAVHAWVEAHPGEEQAAAWLACERAWLLHLRDALGPAFRVDEGDNALVLSSLEPRHGRHAVEFMERTLKRIVRVLDGIARPSEWGKDILVLFDDEDQYYRYVSKGRPDGGEFALSSGMHIASDCSHFVSTRRDFNALEPVIAHEMTHGFLAHLDLPLWLDEGLAVNTERRVSQAGGSLHTPREMRLKHLKFWGEAERAQFWTGESFRRPDEGNELSYDLARVLVEQLSGDWPRFAAFVNAASYQDGGFAAAREHLGVPLDEAVAALLAPLPGELESDPEPQSLLR